MAPLRGPSGPRPSPIARNRRPRCPGRPKRLRCKAVAPILADGTPGGVPPQVVQAYTGTSQRVPERNNAQMAFRRPASRPGGGGRNDPKVRRQRSSPRPPVGLGRVSLKNACPRLGRRSPRPLDLASLRVAKARASGIESRLRLRRKNETRRSTYPAARRRPAETRKTRRRRPRRLRAAMIVKAPPMAETRDPT